MALKQARKVLTDLIIPFQLFPLTLLSLNNDFAFHSTVAIKWELLKLWAFFDSHFFRSGKCKALE